MLPVIVACASAQRVAGGEIEEIGPGSRRGPLLRRKLAGNLGRSLNWASSSASPSRRRFSSGGPDPPCSKAEDFDADGMAGKGDAEIRAHRAAEELGNGDLGTRPESKSR